MANRIMRDSTDIDLSLKYHDFKSLAVALSSKDNLHDDQESDPESKSQPIVDADADVKPMGTKLNIIPGQTKELGKVVEMMLQLKTNNNVLHGKSELTAFSESESKSLTSYSLLVKPLRQPSSF